MSFLGINLAPLGKKLNEIEGDIGSFFGGGQPAAPAPVAPAPAPFHPTTAIAGLNNAPAPGLNPVSVITPPKAPVAFKPLTFPGPVTPADVALAAVKGVGHQLVDPVVGPINTMNSENAQIAANRQPGIVGNLKATAAETSNFAKAVGQSGANAAAYVAPELKILKGAADAPALVRAGVGLINHGASSAPISVAGSLASGDTNPVDIAKNAAVSTLVAGAVPGLKDAGVNHLPATGVHAAGPEGGKKPSVAQSPTVTPPVKLVQTPAGTVKVTEPWGANEPAGAVDVPPGAKPFNEKDRQATGNANPIKTELPEIAPGDHAGAIVNSQRAGDLVDKAAKLALGSMRELTPEDQTLLPRAIEHPELVKTAKDPVKLAQAIADDKVLHDTTHSVNMAVKGEPTAYRNNHALHDWELPEDMPQSSEDFKAIQEQARIHPTIEHGEAVGLQLKDRGYVAATAEYAKRASNALRKQALVKGITEADAGAETPRSFELGGGRAMAVSKAAKKALQGSEQAPENNAGVKGYDKTVGALKKTLLSLTQFHPLNISRKAGSAMTFAGHPLNAAKGVTDAFRSIGKHYSDTIQRQAQVDGAFDDAARIGTPIGTGNDFTVSGGFNPGKHGIGERTIFEQQLPALHIQMVKSIVSDLNKRGVSLDSSEARQAGTRVNEIMGYVNKEVRGLSAPRQRFLSRILLAPQFTRSKWATLKGVATDQGLARRYAIAAVLGDTAAVYAAQTAVGYLSGQKEDNWRDTLIRALVHPSIVTPFKDANGNNLEIDLPSTYISEAFGLLGNLDRGSDGRLKVNVNPTNIPGNVANYGRARLNVPAAAALKVATNTDYAGKQLYNPAATAGNRVKQASENIGAGILPIGVQPIVKPGGNVNPLEASAISALGGSLRTDKTTGKGLDTTQYYNAINTAKLGANQDDVATINKYVSRQTDPSTGAPVSSGVVGGHDNATMLLDNAQKGGDALKSLYDNLSKTNNPDPLWDLPLTAPKGQPSVTAYLQYQAQYEGPEKTGTKQLLEGADAAAANNGWLDKLSADRTAFYGNLPPSSSKSTSTEPAYPTIAAPVQSSIDTYNKLPANQQSAYLQAHPEVTDAFANEAAWTNKIRVLEHAPALPVNQQASPQLQQILNTYNALPASKASGNTGADSGARSAWIKANPQAYSQMSDYLAQTSLNSLTKNAVESLYAGQNSQTYLKDIKNVGTYDITQAPGANGTSTYGILGAQGNPTGVAGTSSGAESAAGSGKSYAKLKKVKLYTGDGDGVGRLSKAKIKKSSSKFAVAGKGKSGKAKVSLKPSLV